MGVPNGMIKEWVIISLLIQSLEKKCQFNPRKGVVAKDPFVHEELLLLKHITINV